MSTTHQQGYYAEEEIGLKEIFNLIVKYKKFLVIFTTIVTIGAVIYSLAITPIYSAKAIMKIGEYKNKKGDYVSLDNASQLVKELEIMFIELKKNDKSKKSLIDSVSLIKGQSSLFELNALATSNELASEELETVLRYIQNKHQKILDEEKERREFAIENIKRNIRTLKEEELPALREQIAQYKKDIKIYETNLLNTKNNLKKLESKTPTLAVLEINQQRFLIEALSNSKQKLINLETKKYDIENNQILLLTQQKEEIENLLKPHNYNNTHVIGQIITYEDPVKPKKRLIVIVAFITGLILSVFIIFFLEFVRNGKEKSTDR